jgi:MFS family permease
MYAGRFFAGFGIGMLSSVAPTYVAEIAPAHIRGNITGLFQVLVVIGVAFSYWINYGVSFMKATSAQWRIPVGFQIAPICIMLCMLPFMKGESTSLA